MTDVQPIAPQAVQPDPAENLQKTYNWIRNKNTGFKVNFETFKADMADPEKLTKTHQWLKANNPNFDVPLDRFAQDMGTPFKKKDHALSPGQPGPEYTPPSQPPVGPLSNGSAGTGEPPQSAPVIPEPRFDDQADREKSLADLDTQIADQKFALGNPEAIAGLAKQLPVNGNEPSKTPEEQSLDYYKGKQEERVLKENQGFAEKDITTFEHAGHMAGQFNKAVTSMFSAFPKTVGIAAQALDRITGDEKPIEEYATYKAGQWLDEKAIEIGITATNPKLENSFLETKVMSGLGSVMGLILTGGMGGSEKVGMQLLNASPKLGAAAAQATKELGTMLRSNMATSAGITQGVQEFEQAKQAGSSDKEAFGVFLKNYGVGLTEVIPIARALDRINQFTKGGMVKTLVNIGIAGGKGSLEEGTQEGVQQYLTNLIAQGSYDPKRLGFDQIIESVGVGMFVGFMLPGIMTAMEHMTPAQKTETKQIIHDALLKQKSNESTKPEQKAAPGERGAVPKPEKQTEPPKGSNEPGGARGIDRTQKTDQESVSKPVEEGTLTDKEKHLRPKEELKAELVELKKTRKKWLEVKKNQYDPEAFAALEKQISEWEKAIGPEEHLPNEESKKPKESPPGEPVISENPKETPLSPAVKGEQPEPNQGAARLASPKGEITPKDIHILAKEAGIDYESKEFMAKSKELTGQEHLDKMSPEELLKVKDYILKQQEHALPIESSSSVLQHPQEGVGEPGSQRERVEPVQQGTETPGAHQKEEPRADLTPEEVKALETERDQKIKEALRPETKLNFISAKDLVKSSDPLGNEEKQDAIKEGYKALKGEYDNLIKEGKPPEEARKIVESQHKALHGRLNDLKKTLNLPKDKYQSVDTDEVVKKIQAEYEEKLAVPTKPKEAPKPVESPPLVAEKSPEPSPELAGGQPVEVSPPPISPETETPKAEIPEEIGLYKKGDQVDFISHDGAERTGKIESHNPETGKYKIRASNGTIWNVEAKNIGVQAESAAPKGKTITSPDQGKPSSQKTPSKPFNMAQRVKDIFTHFQIPINEGSLRNAYEGVYKYFTQGVRLHALWDIYVAAHEGLHAFDNRHGIWENVKKNGSQKLKNELLDAYENFYPAPKKNASIKERIKEGMAMITQYYLADRTPTEQRFPEAIKHILQPGGQFFKDEVGQFVEQMQTLADEYFNLNPQDKVNARIKWSGTDSRRGVGFWTKVATQLGNDLTPAEIVDNLLGGVYRATAIIPNVTMLRNIGSVVSNWIKHPFGVVSKPQTYLGNGQWGPTKSGYRVFDYMKKLENPDNLISFNSLLIARRQYEDYLSLQDLEDQITDLTQTDPTSKDLPGLIEAHEKLNSILENNKMPKDLAEGAVKNLEGQFKDELKIYDALNQDKIDFLEATELITPEKAQEFRAKRGYAAFQRFVEDEYLGDTDGLNISSSGKAAVKSLQQYGGSALQIIPPTYSQMLAINEVLTKGQRNLVWLAWAQAAKANKEVAQIFEAVTALDVDLKSRDIQTVMEKGVKKYYKIGEEVRLFGEALTPTQIEFVSEVMRGFARLFQTGTTTAYPIFGMINISMDAWTRMAQTKTGLIPLVSDLPTIGKAFGGMMDWLFKLNIDNEFTDFMALGGRRSTYAAQQLVDADASLGQMLNKGWWQKTKKIGEIGLQMVELPTNFSELIGRGTEYVRAIKMGYPSNVAMLMAANVSVNFSNKGKYGGKIGQEMVKWVSYMGASIQALHQFIKTAKNDPKRVGTVVAFATAITAMGALLTYMLGDDDEKEMLADQLPEDYARWIYLPNSVFGGAPGLIRFRMPEQIGVLGGLTQLYFSHLFKQKPLLFKEYYQLLETPFPNQVKFSQGPGVLMNSLPTAISPEIQTLTGTRFYPELLPIVPKNLQDYAEWRQYDKYTSRTAKAIGELTADNLKISPKKFDFYIRAKFGRATQLIQSLAESAIYGDPVKSYIPMWQEYDRVAFSGRMYNKFWDIKEEADKTAKILDNWKRLKGDIGPIGPLIQAKMKAMDLKMKAAELRDAMDNINNGIELSDSRKRDLFNMILHVVENEEKENGRGVKEPEK